MYTAVILDEKSKNDLKAVSASGFLDEYETNINNVSLPHHMTINLGEFDETLNDKEILGMQAILRVDEFFWDDKVCCAKASDIFALHVENNSVVDLIPIKTLNDEKYCAHVTLGVKNGGRPRDSKYLFGSEHAFRRTFKPLTLLGDIEIAH